MILSYSHTRLFYENNYKSCSKYLKSQKYVDELCNWMKHIGCQHEQTIEMYEHNLFLLKHNQEKGEWEMQPQISDDKQENPLRG